MTNNYTTKNEHICHDFREVGLQDLTMLYNAKNSPSPITPTSFVDSR